MNSGIGRRNEGRKVSKCRDSLRVAAPLCPVPVDCGLGTTSEPREDRPLPSSPLDRRLGRRSSGGDGGGEPEKNLNRSGQRDERELLERVAQGDADARAAFIEHYREPLLRIIGVHLDARVRTRVDPADVLQDMAVEALQRFDDYARNPTMPPFLWLRFLAVQRVQLIHRVHLGAGQRDVRRELRAGCGSGTNSADLAALLVSGRTTPSQAAIRRETQAQIREALDQMDPLDRDVLVLRHFEQLKNVEAAQCLGIEPTAASKRYQRALRRLGELLGT